MEKLNYKISSRTAILLGRENVSKADGAIIELIKNSYDADADLCYLIFDIANGCIFIIDNGCGMDANIIKNNWLTIGTDNKKIKFKSNKNRIRSGEKGIGRLALDRLGSSYELFTKTLNNKILYLKTDWDDFECESTNLEDIQVELSELNSSLEDILCNYEICENIKLDSQGTIIKINNIRDDWKENDLNGIAKMLGYLVPPLEQSDFKIYYKDSYSKRMLEIENSSSEEFDYKIKAKFDGNDFKITLYRNEYDIKKIPPKIFEEKEFSKFPYRNEDFKSGIFEKKYTISEILNTNEQDKISKVKDIGPFDFNYTFMKVQVMEKDVKRFFYKQISKDREIWIKENSGIKIYRDGFMVRPYGDNSSSEGYDWLGLDARKAQSPAAITHKGMGWKVRNLQGQGTVCISRIYNDNILDKSSREGIIENEYFSLLKEIIRNIISIFEKDRSYISMNFKNYLDKIYENEIIKNESAKIAEKILNSHNNEQLNLFNSDDNKKLAQAIEIFRDEREELISEIKLLRSLSTNGLITTSIVHDLKTINAVLVQRVNNLKDSINNNDKELTELNLKTLLSEDEFLKSWISVLINQVKSDRRKRKKEKLYTVINEAVNNLIPILTRKNIAIKFECANKLISRKIFITDIESIIYNLIINSVESFEHSRTKERCITINLYEKNDKIIINYKDNGDGIGSRFNDPYEIFDFGTTSKYDIYGEKTGTGLGMYIISSTINEYNGEYNLIKWEKEFELQLIIPKGEDI